MAAVEANPKYERNLNRNVLDQGFVSTTGRYLTRDEAWELATKKRQFDPEKHQDVLDRNYDPSLPQYPRGLIAEAFNQSKTVEPGGELVGEGTPRALDEIMRELAPEKIPGTDGPAETEEREPIRRMLEREGGRPETPTVQLKLQAHHGTPHKVEGGFKLEKIGTGEGAQAYGWGLYFAASRGCSGQL